MGKRFFENGERKRQPNKKHERNAFQGANSRPQTQTLHPSNVDQRPVFVFETMIAFHMAHARVTHGALHTQRAQTLIIRYPKPVPAQGTQCYGKPRSFQRDFTYDMSKKHKHLTQAIWTGGLCFLF